MNACISNQHPPYSNLTILRYRLSVVTVLPSIATLWKQNPLGPRSVDLLMSYNIAANSTDDCDFLQQAVGSWLSSVAIVGDNYVKTKNYDPVKDVYVLWAEIRPVRCYWQRSDGVITNCDLYAEKNPRLAVACNFWNLSAQVSPDSVTDKYLANVMGIRPGEAMDLGKSSMLFSDFDGIVEETSFYVRSVFNESHAVSLA